MFIDRQASSYDALCRSFRWQLPERFNIGVDVCGRWAEDRSRFALYYEDASGFSSAHTFWDIQREANRLSNVLAALGTLPGDRVALILPQCPEAAIAHVAIYQMGALAVPLSPLCTPDALAYRLGDAGAHLAIVDATTLPTLRQLRDKLPQLQHLLGVGAAAGKDLRRWEEVLEHASPRYTPLATAANDPAMILYGSGSTARPKGMLLAHRTLLGRLSGYVCSHDFFPQPRDLFWSSADWASTAGLGDGLLSTWHFGMPLLAYPGRFDAVRAFALIEKYGIRNSSLSPCDLQRMMEAVPDPRAIYDLDLRTLVSAGGPVAAAVSHWAREKLGVTINEIFGQTEMGDMLGNCASRWPLKPGAMGRPYPGHRLAIVDHQGQVLPPGELGELAVHRQCNGEDDPLVMLGYWQNPEATAGKFIAEGWVLTGELAKIDADGNFWYQGRAEEPFHPGGQPMHG
ncbi:MAG: Acetyl-coenzyme A synthetase [Candidatus Accumulibacter phosphatis]|uniref:Acetyl-coenzyme A synthetase n=1 Tax=Candidatus Accumulibacter phosphatis TaxID=327160 RepID=A0A080LSV7_9PROT|nr:MAG: Acetyl-coenzyme A synthetase [Candidatus Accumulibacter phosphatis]